MRIKERANLNRAIALFEKFRGVGVTLELQTVVAFLYICQMIDERDGGPVYIYDVSEALGVEQCTGSRNVSYLTDRGSRNSTKGGPGLIELGLDPDNLSRKIIKLTEKGKRFRDEIC